MTQLNYDDVIEKMACAIYAPNETCDVTRRMYVSYEDSETQELIRRQAKAALKALQDALPTGLTLEEELCGKDLKGEDTILGGEIYDDRAELYQQLKQLGRE